MFQFETCENVEHAAAERGTPFSNDSPWDGAAVVTNSEAISKTTCLRQRKKSRCKPWRAVRYQRCGLVSLVRVEFAFRRMKVSEVVGSQISSTCGNVWMTSPFLINHEKAVRTRCHTHKGTLTDQEMTHKQDVCEKSRSSPKEVYKESEHVQRQHAPSDHTACAAWTNATNTLQKLLTTQSATVSHGCTRSLLKPCSTKSNRSIHVFFSQTFAASGWRSTLSVGSHATL